MKVGSYAETVSKEEKGSDNKEFQAQANGVEVKAGSAQYLQQLEEQRAMKVMHFGLYSFLQFLV
jgi:hypothetical protein